MGPMRRLGAAAFCAVAGIVLTACSVVGAEPVAVTQPTGAATSSAKPTSAPPGSPSASGTTARAEVAGCPTDGSTTIAQLCWVGGEPEDSDAPLLVLFGDSHASHWWRAAAEVGRIHGFRVALLTKPNCPAALVELVDEPYPECESYRRSSLEAVAQARPDVVVVGSSHAYGPRVAVAGAVDPARSAQRWQSGLAEVLETLSSSAQQVLLVRDVPRFAEDVAACMDSATDPVAECGLPEDQAVSDTAREIEAAETAAAAGMDNVAHIDFNGLICASGFCSPIEAGGQRRYVDSNHLNASFGIKAAPALAEAVTRAVPSRPAPPRGVRAVASPSGITVQWRPPAASGGSPVTSYTATAVPIDGGATLTCTSAGRACTVAGAGPPGGYDISVTAENREGGSLPAPASPG